MECLSIRQNRPLKTANGTLLVVCFLAAALTGCQGSRPGTERAPANSIQFSPNAEPLSGGPLGHPKCEDALSGWFDRLDSRHLGTIGRDAFMADAGVQFDRMDRNHAGYVTAADLSEFRAPYEPATPSDSPPDGGAPSGGRADTGSPSRQRGPSVDTRADPVMSADKTASFKVTKAEFLAQAGDIFNGLDHNHDGRITRQAVLDTCAAAKK